MITEPWFWVVIAFVLAALAALAIWKNGGIDVLIGPKGLVFKTHPPKQAVAPRGKREAAAVDRVAEGASGDHWLTRARARSVASGGRAGARAADAQR